MWRASLWCRGKQRAVVAGVASGVNAVGLTSILHGGIDGAFWFVLIITSFEWQRMLVFHCEWLTINLSPIILSFIIEMQRQVNVNVHGIYMVYQLGLGG